MFLCSQRNTAPHKYKILFQVCCASFTLWYTLFLHILFLIFDEYHQSYPTLVLSLKNMSSDWLWKEWLIKYSPPWLAFSARRGNPQHRPACVTVSPASGPNLLLYPSCPFLGWTGEFALDPRPLGCVLWTALRLFLLSLIPSLTVTHPSTQLIAAFCFPMAGVNLPALLLICVC